MRNAWRIIAVVAALCLSSASAVLAADPDSPSNTRPQARMAVAPTTIRPVSQRVFVGLHIWRLVWRARF